jgi:general L-amino acid transport system permease protein
MSDNVTGFSTEAHKPIPLWRDVRVLAVLAQAVFVVLVVIVAGWLYSNLMEALDALGMDLGFGFLSRQGGFLIGQGYPFARTDTYLQAYFAGVINSAVVIVVGLVLTTFLGVISGIALLSDNWLVRTIFRVYVEVMRNTPLLVQLFFIYFALLLKLPSLSDRIELPGPIYLSNRGIMMIWPHREVMFGNWLIFVVGGALIGAVLWRWRARRKRLTGENSQRALWGSAPVLLLAAVGWLVLPGVPFTFEAPVIDGFRVEGGLTLTPELAAILFGLVIYTAAFIADIVRAGILAVPHGQIEAARAQGLTEAQVMRLVVLPQALRVIVPPLTNQYLNLAKNSSLAIGVGYPDLYAISNTIFNQSGRAVQVIAMIMATYLVMSLSISAVMNFVNRRIQIVER